MGRTLLLTRDKRTKWGKIASQIALSFVDTNVRLPENPINPRTKKKYNYDPLPRMSRFNLLYGYKLAQIHFSQIHGVFNCREGLTRNLQDAQGTLSSPRSIIIVRESLTNYNTPSKKYRKLFKEHWASFVEEFLACSDIGGGLVEKFALLDSTSDTLSFPVTGKQKLTMGTIGSALVGLIRNNSIFLSEDGFRNYEEIIIEMGKALKDAWEVGKETGKRPPATYYIHTSNVTLWHILHYLDMMKDVGKISADHYPNGPANFITYNTEGISKAIRKASKTKMDKMLELLGGADAPIIDRFTANVRTAILDKAGVK